MTPDENKLLLPVSVVSRIDVGRLLREVKALDDFLAQAAIREPGTTMKLPRTSRLMDELIQANKLNPLVQVDRQKLTNFLQTVYERSPILHMSFNADPSPLFSQRLVTWLRKEIDPYILIQTGLQPSIGAGCVLRTKNQVFDFSLREHFKQKRDVLVNNLEGSTP